MIPPTRTIILRWVENFCILGNFENQTSQGRPFNLLVDGANNHFLVLPEPSKDLRRTATDLGISYSTIQNILWSLLTYFRTWQQKPSVVTIWICSTSCLFTIRHILLVIPFPVTLVKTIFLMSVFIPSQNGQKFKALVFNVRKPRRDSTIWIT